MSTFAEYTTKTVEQTAAKLQTSITDGLSEQQRANRLRQYGPNELAREQVRWEEILLRQFKSSFVYLLLAAGVIASLLGEALDGVIIFLFVAINATLGFYQEYRSEQTIKLLKQYTRATSKVKIGGTVKTVPTSGLVPGDVVELSAGDLIPADLRLIFAHDLVIDESVLSGESAPVQKSIQPLSQVAGEIYAARPIGFAATTVISGAATGIVVATGAAAVMGEVAKLAGQTQRESSFEKNLNTLSRFVLRLVGVTIAGVFVANLLIKGSAASPVELAIFSVALAVSVIPEALPVVTTFSLSRGALHLARNKVVVKRLLAIEDLGGIEVLCTDKTGTLTENKLSVGEIYGADPEMVVRTAALASAFFSLSAEKPDAFDTALWNRLDNEQRQQLRAISRLGEIPFDPERKRNSVIIVSGRRRQLVVRGAPEVILKFCKQPLSSKRKELTDWIDSQGRRGRRVIAVATKSTRSRDNYDVSEEESNLRFVGLVSFIDPIKSSSRAAIKKAQALGVAVKILTGDSAEVAGAVGREVGLLASSGDVITAATLDTLQGKKQYEAVERYKVFARVSPQQKYRIIELLRQQQTVGFLGEGINDAPALKIANVGLVVAGASDIARESSDIVLLQKSLGVIVDGIREGRQVFANTIKYIRATLASNFGNFYAVAVSSLLVNYLPMLPLQILLVNLLTDFPMIAVATDTVDTAEVSKPQWYNIKEIVLLATILGITSSLFDFIFFAIFSRIGPGQLQTNWFIGSVLTELVFIYSIRTRFPFWRSRPPSRIFTTLAVLAGLATVSLPFLPFGQEVFHFISPTALSLVLDLGLVGLYFVVTEAVKLLYYHLTAPHVQSKT